MQRLVLCFVALLVAASPASIASRPGPALAPDAFFGFRMGDVGRLATWDRTVAYLHHVDEASPRVAVEEVGRTTRGRPYLLVTISAADTMTSLAQVRDAQHRLADPRATSERDAARLARAGKAIVLVGAGVHSTETGGSQMLNELVWHLATDRSPETERLLHELVILIVPSQNPDGLQMAAEWHARNAGTPYEDAPLPELYHPYAGHDNNRDGFMQTQVETQHLNRLLYQEWLPEVYLDLHQMGPSRARIFVPPYRSPVNPNVDPLVWSQANVLGQTMAARLQEAGKTGVLWGETYTGYWQGANSTTPWWHNIVGMLSEVASARSTSPILQEVAHPAPGALAVPPPALAGQPHLPPPSDTQFRMNYPDPWLGGAWTPRDVVEYHLIATMGLLEGAANNREMLKRNFYRMHRRTIDRFAQGRPYAFLIPRAQHDPGAAEHLIHLLRTGGAEVHRAREAFAAGATHVEAGSAIVLLAQPFGRWVKDLLEPQSYPEVRWPSRGTPPERPYDVTAWTLGMQMGVSVHAIETPFTAALELIDAHPHRRGRLAGDGHVFAFRREMNASTTLVNRLLAAGAELGQVRRPLSVGVEQWPAGAIVGRRVARDVLERAAADTGVDLATIAAWPDDGVRLQRPRVGVVEPWGGSIDAGWTRWVLEQYGFAFTSVRPGDLREAIASRFDVIVIPEIPPLLLMRGLQGATVRPEHRGGLGDKGITALKAFLRAGGTIVTLGNAGEFAIDMLDVPAVVASRADDPDTAYVPGSLLRLSLSDDHPITDGLPGIVDAMNIFNSAYAPGRGADGLRVIARYPEEPLVRSGYATGEARLRGQLAAFEAPIGAGRVVVLGFRVQHRGQTWATFKLLFNALLTSGSAGERELSVDQ